MADKIVFLDVDGILCHIGYDNPDTLDIDPDKVQKLAYICQQTSAKVVIISSWRGNEEYTPHIYHELRRILQDAQIPVIGDAPYIPAKILHYNPEKITTLEGIANLKIVYGTGRGAEVAKYIQDNNITHFAILDDEDFKWSDYHLEQHWVHPTYYSKTHGGLQQHHVEQAIQILNT